MSSDSQISILIVDDRPDKLLAMEAMLQPLGYNIHKADSGKEALRLLLKEPVHLVILDVNMPVLNGFETATLIRERERFAELPIIFVSEVDATEVDMERGYALGAVDYIHTPVAPAILRARVSNFIALRLRTQQLEEANTELSELNARLQSFVYTVAHDLRAPLRSINSFTAILLEECAKKLAAGEMDLLYRIAFSGLRMNELVDDLLHYSRISQDKVTLETVSVRRVIAAAIEELRGDITSKKATVAIEGEIPDVIGNAALLSQVFRNLLDNGLKFSRKGVSPVVRVHAIDAGPQTKILIEDNGIGIAPEYQERIFGVFERLHNYEDYPGTGIGLAIVRKAIERMGGELGLTSDSDRGSCFWIKLPKASPNSLSYSHLEEHTSIV